MRTKRLVSLLLCLVMVFSTFAILANAKETIKIVDISGASIDENNKITLNNAKADGKNPHIDITGVDVEIELKGTSSITAIASVITSNGNITFSGDGDLTATAADGSSALYVQGGGKQVTFNGTGKLTFKTADVEAIKVDGQITFNDGTVVANTSDAAAIVAYGTTKYDAYNGITIDDDMGDYGITFGDKMAPADSSQKVVDIKGTSGDSYALKDEYTKDNKITDKYGNTYVKYEDAYGNTVYDVYDKYGSKVVDAYPADNATGASWNYVSKFQLKTIGTGDVTLDAENWWYDGDFASSVTIKKTATGKITPDDKNVTRSGDNLIVRPYSRDGITVSKFTGKDLVQNGKFTVKDNTDDLISTGCTIELKVDGVVVDKVTVILIGDINGDGIIDVSDVKKAVNHSINKTKLKGINFTAGNITAAKEGDKVIDISDVKKIVNYSIKKSTTL